MPDLTLQPLLGAGINFSGMNSYAPPDALPPGKMALCSNVRANWGKPVVRLPLTTIGSPASNTGWCAGGAEFSQDGTPTIFAAIGYGPGIVNTNGTNFYKSTNGGTSWTTLGSGSGPYGSTVFDSQDTRVEFQVVTDRTWNGQTAYDLVVIQDGFSAPLIYGKSNSSTFSGGYGIAKVYQPPAPLGGTGLQFSTGFNNAWPINVPADITIINGANITLYKGSGLFSGAVSSSYVAGSLDTATASFTSNLNLSNTTGAAAGQFILIANAYCSLPISGATNPTTGPIVITTTAAHGLATGQTVTIALVGGNTAANGTWVITVISATTFSLNGSQGNGS